MKILKRTIRWRYAFVGSVLFIGLIACVGAFVILDKELFPGEDFPQFYVKAEMPPSYGLQETTAVMTQIEEAAKTLPASEVAAIVSNIGIHTPTSGLAEGVTYGSNFGEVIIELTPKQERTRGVDEIIADMRNKTLTVSGVEELNYITQAGGPPQGEDVEVKVKGDQFDKLTELTGVLKTKLAQLDGVYDIRDDFRIGKSELRIHLKPREGTSIRVNDPSKSHKPFGQRLRVQKPQPIVKQTRRLMSSSNTRKIPSKISQNSITY